MPAVTTDHLDELYCSLSSNLSLWRLDRALLLREQSTYAPLLTKVLTLLEKRKNEPSLKKLTTKVQFLNTIEKQGGKDWGVWGYFAKYGGNIERGTAANFSELQALIQTFSNRLEEPVNEEDRKLLFFLICLGGAIKFALQYKKPGEREGQYDPHPEADQDVKTAPDENGEQNTICSAGNKDELYKTLKASLERYITKFSQLPPCDSRAGSSTDSYTPSISSKENQVEPDKSPAPSEPKSDLTTPLLSPEDREAREATPPATSTQKNLQEKATKAFEATAFYANRFYMMFPAIR